MQPNIKHFNLEITKKCNQKCFYCFNDSGNSRAKDELSLKEWQHTISEIAMLGYKSVHITGGEPFLHPQVLQILQHSIELGLDTTILSNGFKIFQLANEYPTLFKQLKTAQISLDSMDPKMNNIRRGFRNAFEDAMNAISKFSELNVPIEISTTVSDENIEHIQNIGLFCKLVHASLILRPIISVGRAANVWHSELFHEQLGQITNRLKDTHQVVIIRDRFHYVADEGESDKIFLENGILTIEATGKIRSKSIFHIGISQLIKKLKAA